MVSGVACGGGGSGGGTTSGDAPKPTGTSAAKTSAPPAPPPPSKPAAPSGGGATKVEPKDMPPFEAIQFKPSSEKPADSGWPKFDVVNLGKKPIAFAAMYGFAYDKSGKLIKRTTTPLSWNSDLAPGDKAMFPVSIGSFEKDKVTADTFELCYDSIKFKGDDKATSDSTLCTDKRPKGGIKSSVKK